MKKESNVDLICSVAELAGLFEKSTSVESFLQKVVSVVAWHMKAAVCSVYLLDDSSQELVLVANQGLNPELIGKLRLKLGEGITGKALQELRAIREASGPSSKFYKFIPGSFEDRYHAFLAVPILRGLTRVGVLVVQDAQKDYFDENDTKALRAIATQLGSTIENARLLMDLHRIQTSAQPDEIRLEPELGFIRGTAASQGIIFAKSTSLGHVQTDRLLAEELKALHQTEDDFRHALERTELQINDIQKEMETRLEDVASLIFSAHLLMLKDDAFSGDILRLIRKGLSPQTAIVQVVDRFIELFSRSANPMLREKVQDVKDLGHRLLHNLHPKTDSASDYKGQIVIAKELLPSDIFKLAAQKAQGLILIESGVSSHVTILARSLKIPLVITREERLLKLPEDTPVLLDAYQGHVIVNPAANVVCSYEAIEEANQKAHDLEAQVRPTTATDDGHTIRLMANVNLLSDLPVVLRMKAEGIGLYRSELPFIVRNDFPSEEEQHRIYRRILETMEGRPVTFRTLDIGGDKMLSYFPSVNEANPFLGLRAIRFSLRNKDIFCQQLRALLRAGHGYELKIMFPLVSSVDDFVDARHVVQECIRQLTQEGVPHNGQPLLGVMVELPSAVEVAGELAQEADFLSIGTNDLVQYILAVDRTNAHVSDMYLSQHPAVLRSLKRVADAVLARKKELSLCGDMARDPQMIPFLLGIGINILSLDASHIPSVQTIVSGLSMTQAKAQADAMLRLGRINEVKAYLASQHAS
ncbi:MAG TPA: phosphoenolpyruvate--protein phosphotransferase [Verrucomicrobia bacterium]|nr:MAG: phosphoenolpyruvate--protein phosphotransferase [Lentisphaerae bacterium GWF2_57_35]HBA83757.1 phosphoenolpyruvate--protein phosphotransferase [Verrucomicrobiota bacterium]